MVKSCVESISSFLIKNGYISSSKYEWCCYVLEKRLVKIISFRMILVVGLKLNMLLETFIFTTSFCLLRKYADGYHAKTFTMCLIYSLLIVITSIKFVGPSFAKYPGISALAYCISVLAFVIHIRQIDRKAYKNKLFIRNVFIISSLVVICELTTGRKTACLLISSMLFTIITIYLKKVIKGERKHEC